MDIFFNLLMKKNILLRKKRPVTQAILNISFQRKCFISEYENPADHKVSLLFLTMLFRCSNKNLVERFKCLFSWLSIKFAVL